MTTAQQAAFSRARDICIDDGIFVAEEGLEMDPSPYTDLPIFVLEAYGPLPPGVGGMGYDYLVALDVSLADLADRFEAAYGRPTSAGDLAEWHDGRSYDPKYAGLLVIEVYSEEIVTSPV